ncbi:GatB/YqeY domain-containing protein [Leptospirillum ferriphilum]|uniref:GatB/YqeY domain-containing protein n=1 Tax=Leptospirillum ferriphilum TaxID=178606 RepID=UPI003EE5F165
MTNPEDSSQLLSRLRDDQKECMRSGNKERLSIIRMALSAIRNAEIEKGKGATLTDPEVVGVLSGMVRKIDESVEQFEKGGRPDLAEKESRERQILKEYLPRPLDEAELDRLVDEAVQSTGARSPRDMGSVMKWLGPRTSGRADNRLVSQKVKARLGEQNG